MKRTVEWSTPKRVRASAQPAPATVPKHRSKKDTKRWCKGVPGREHDYQWETWAKFYSPRTQPVYIEVCQACRRNRKMHWPRWEGRWGETCLPRLGPGY